METEITEKPGTVGSAARWMLRYPRLSALGAGSFALAAYAVSRPIQLLNEAIRLRLALAGIHSRYTAVDGHRIHYYEGGPADGPPVVLVHGLGGYAEQWAALLLQLAAAGRRVYAMDLLGYGRSARPDSASYSVPEEAEIVEGFLRAKGIGRYDLAGWSMGGWVALQVALEQNRKDPLRIQRLMLFDSAGLRYQLDWDPDLFVPDTPAKLRELNRLLFPQPPRLPGFMENAIIRQAQRDGWVIQRSMGSMLTGLDIEDGRLGELKMPVLIVWGRHDHIIPLSVGERMHAAIPHSVLEVYDGCGHLGPVQCARRIGPRMIRFLQTGLPETDVLPVS